MKALEGLTRRVTGIGLIVLAAMPSPHTLVNASCELDTRTHFAAWQEPDLFTTETGAAFRPLR